MSRSYPRAWSPDRISEETEHESVRDLPRSTAGGADTCDLTTSASGGSAAGVILSQPFRGQAGLEEHSDANGQVPVTALRRPGGPLTLWAIDHPTFVVPSDRRVMGLTHWDPNLHRATTVSGGEI